MSLDSKKMVDWQIVEQTRLNRNFSTKKNSYKFEICHNIVKCAH